MTETEARIKDCYRIPSLASINSNLRELLNSESGYTGQIAEVIQRDPGITERLLRLVNSVYFGLATTVKTVEDAVFYLGVKQIRQLALLTPILEDFRTLTHQVVFPWQQFWKHCIATAILTRELAGSVMPLKDDTFYIAGLIHDVGKIVTAAVFPDSFAEIYRRVFEGEQPLHEAELHIIGLPHTEIGAMYLRNNSLPPYMVETARFHHQLDRATKYRRIVATVQIADLLARHANLGQSGNQEVVERDDWLNAPGWELLFPNGKQKERLPSIATLDDTVEKMPDLLDAISFGEDS